MHVRQDILTIFVGLAKLFLLFLRFTLAGIGLEKQVEEGGDLGVALGFAHGGAA
jgi:hypothetical protein